MSLESIVFLLADLLLKGATVVTAAWALTGLMRRGSAANRSAIWSAAFLVLLLLPVTLAISPRWSWFTSQPQETSLLLQVAYTPKLEGSQTSPPALDKAGFFDSASLSMSGLKLAFVATWFAGFLFFLARRMAGTYQLRKLKRQSISPPMRLLELAREIEQAYQIRRAANVRLSEDQTAPLTWGTLRPVIMLPVEAVEWNEEVLGIVLQHEYAHIRRHDSWLRLIAQLASAIHWHNPLVWKAVRRLRLEQEQAADDMVLQAGVDPVTYADELIASVRRLLQSASIPEQALAMAQSSTLGTRVDAVLDNERDRRPLSWSLLVGSIAAILLFLAGSALAQIAATDGTPNGSIQPKADPLASPSAATTKALDAVPAGNGATEVPQPANPDPTHLLSAAPSGIVEADSPAKQPAKFGDHPIEINAEHTRFEGGVAVAEGAAKLEYLGVKIVADYIRYDPATRNVVAKRNVDFTVENGNKVTGKDTIVEYNLETKAMKLSGPSRIILKDTEGSK